MTVRPIHIRGMPYVPGVAHGMVQHRIDAVTRQSVLVISQDEISFLTSLPAAFIILDGAPLSHTMIGLFGYGIPTIIVSSKILDDLPEGVELRLDGASGVISNDPGIALSPVLTHPAMMPGNTIKTADAEPVCLRASVRSIEAASKAMTVGVESIGLVRSEFFMPEAGGVPDMPFYRDVFAELCATVKPLPVTIRLLDVAADKIPGWLPRSEAFTGALGLQGVRLYHMDPVDKVIDAQLSAISELVNDYRLRLLIPYLIRIEEYDYWRTKIRQQLPERVPVGAMAETPASVLDIAQMLEHADFVAIGCNDLMQSLYAADRDRPELRQCLDPYSPMLFRFFRHVAEQAADHLHDIQLCGVLAQINGVLPVLLGLGYRTFSVDAAFVPYLGDVVTRCTRGDCERLAAQVCEARTTAEVLEILQLPTDNIWAHYPWQ